MVAVYSLSYIFLNWLFGSISFENNLCSLDFFFFFLPNFFSTSIHTSSLYALWAFWIRTTRALFSSRPSTSELERLEPDLLESHFISFYRLVCCSARCCCSCDSIVFFFLFLFSQWKEGAKFNTVKSNNGVWLMIYFSRPTEMYRKVLRGRRRYIRKKIDWFPPIFAVVLFKSSFDYISYIVYNQINTLSSRHHQTWQKKEKKQSCLCVIGCAFGKNRSDCQGNGEILAGTKLCTRRACAKVSRRTLAGIFGPYLRVHGWIWRARTIWIKRRSGFHGYGSIRQ